MAHVGLTAAHLTVKKLFHSPASTYTGPPVALDMSKGNGRGSTRGHRNWPFEGLGVCSNGKLHVSTEPRLPASVTENTQNTLTTGKEGIPVDSHGDVQLAKSDSLC